MVQSVKSQLQQIQNTPQKTNMTMENPTMNEDVSPIKNGEVPVSS